MKSSLLLNCIVCCLFALLSFDASAQKDKNEKPPKEAKAPKGGKGDDKKAQPASAKSNNAVSARVLETLSSMTRDDKNKMTNCPLHGGHMELSDNYRANASDYRESANYPFAYQLNYRRSCKRCTQALEAEDKAIAKADRRDADEPSFVRCNLHNETMFINGEHRPMNYEKNPSEDTPHAQAYGFKYYCKTCNKVHKAQEKSAGKLGKNE